MKKLISYLISTVFLFPNLMAQCMLSEVSLEDRIDLSKHIVEGKVLEKRSFWDDTYGNILTANKIEVYKSFKDDISTGHIEILTRGGAVGLEMQTDHPSLQLEVGVVGIFLLKNHQETVLENQIPGLPIYQPATGPQGFIQYNLSEGSARDPFNVYENIETDLYEAIEAILNKEANNIKDFDLNKWKAQPTRNGVMSISNFSPTTVSGGTDVVLTINGSGFGASQGNGVVEFSNADNGGSTINILPLEDEYCSWSDTQIKVHVPADACSGNFEVIPDGGSAMTSPSALIVSYAQLNVQWPSGTPTNSYQTQHKNDDGIGGYTWSQNTAFASSDAAAPFLRALQTWCYATGIYWQEGATTPSSTVANDGINIVTFDITSVLPGGVLGRCTSRWSGCGTGGSKDCETGAGTPAFQWFVNELDIVFNNDFTWHYSTSLPPFSPTSSYDFESVAVHELGHGHQLGHLLPSSSVMYYAIANNSAKRTLSAGETAGAADVFSRSTTSSVCGQALMSLGINCAAIGLPVELVSFSVTKNGEKALLSWQTASELNNDYFELERSTNGLDFTPIGMVKGFGNSNKLLDYDFMDDTPELGVNFYRLKQVDYDGSYEYSELRSVSFEQDGKEMIFLHPNPTNSLLNISYFSSKEQTVQLDILAVSGINVKSQSLSLNKGDNILSVHLEEIPSGTYWLRFMTDNSSTIKRITKLE